MILGLTVRAVYHDSDLIEISGMRANERFRGETQVYATVDEVDAWAALLRAVPSGASAEPMSIRNSHNNAEMRCVVRNFDSLGHLSVAVEIVADGDAGCERCSLVFE